MERYVLRKGKYPNDAVEVVSREGDIVNFASMGGGFVKSTLAVDFDKNFRPFNDDLDILVWKKTEVVIEDCPSVSGYVQGSRWNGWVMPCFTKEAIEAAQKDGAFALLDMKFSEEEDAFHVRFEGSDDEAEIYTGFNITVEGVRLHVYGIGAGSWCWEQVTAPTMA